MTTPSVEHLERRVLILAPFGKDATLVGEMLQREGVPCIACDDAEHVARELNRGAAAVLLTEEALLATHEAIVEIIHRQPPWSDLPVLLLTLRGADSPMVMRAIDTLGNVTLLERPVRVAALASAVRSALRARERQYQTRAHLLDREQADRRKDEFLATLAHELRNPLAPIRNSVTMLRLSAGGEASNHVWDMMDRQINHMVRLVDDLMEVSRITRGKIELRRQPLEINSVIETAIETSRPLIENASHELKVSLPDTPLIVEGDAVRLAQVFSNLLNNAVKYTDPFGRIAVDVKRVGARVEVRVTDSGIGMSETALHNVFDMFVQANSRDSRAQSGLGIGLTLVRSLVEMHGGTVAAHSEGIGHGSQFVVALPLARTNRVTPSTSNAIFSGHLKGRPRVLVVDDNCDAADSLGAMLEVLGAEVCVTHDGPSALTAVESFHPLAVFLDIGMPGMDGYQVANKIRERGSDDEPMLVALTGWGQARDRRQTEAAGFDHHLVKPADLSMLQSLLTSIGEQ